ncbi:PARP6, partial [Symbiodinium necroappetens]
PLTNNWLAIPWVSIVADLNPETNVVHYFEAVALPFGAVSAVTGFKRMARARRKVLSTLFFLVTTNFYDNFCQLELEPLQESARSTAEEALDLLGWRIAQGAKALPFATSFNMLGACISFEKAFKGDVLVRNKEGRIESIKEVVRRCMKARRCDNKRMHSVKGKLLFAAGHVFGNSAQIDLGVWANGHDNL